MVRWKVLVASARTRRLAGEYPPGESPTLYNSTASALSPLLPSRVARAQDSYLVDSASSHMLVSKIKPCMSKYKQYIP
jgi:hypothetical protein